MTQNDLIRAHLERGHPITPLGALSAYGCFRLGARIYDLRREGMKIDRTMVTDQVTGKTYAQYRLK